MKTEISIHIKRRHLIYFFLLSLLLAWSTDGAFAHWTTKGPYTGGNVSCFLAADTLLYVGSATGGVYWSKNQAVSSWQYVNYTGLSSPDITSLASFGSTSSPAGMKIIAGTADAGIFLSRDKGISWAASNNGLANTSITALISMGACVFAGTAGGGVFRSADSAKTWAAVNNGITGLDITCFATNGTAIAAGTAGGGVFISNDNGLTWTAANTGLADLSVNALIVSGTTLLAGTGSGIFTASIAAPVWSQANTGLGNTVINGFAAHEGTVYAATNGGVYSSPGQGVSWSAANDGLQDTVTAVAVFNNRLYAGNHRKGIYRSTSLSTVQWTMFNTGFNNLVTYTVYNSGTLVIVATERGVYVSRDLAASYEAANSGLTDSLHVNSLAFAGSSLYAATTYGGVFVSPDTGRTWAEVNTGLGVMDIKRIIASGSHLVAASGDGKVYSTALGTIAWQQGTGLPSGVDITSLATDGNTIFAGTHGNGVFKSTDAVSWTSFNAGLGNSPITSLAVSNGKVFAGTDGAGIFRSPVISDAWVTVNNGLPSLTIYSLCASGDYVVAGYKGGVAATSGGGYEWKATNVLLYLPSYARVHTVSFASSSTRIFAATPANTVYSNSVGELPVTASDPLGIHDPMSSIGLIEVCPNPGNGHFRLELSEAAGENATVTVYDHSGSQIDKFPYRRGEMLGQSYESGVYFIHVETDKGRGSVKVVIE